MGDGDEPIEDDEILYRRIQLVHYDPAEDSQPSPKAFRPGKHDETGISLWRAKYVTPSEAAKNDRGKQYWIAELRAGDLRAHGLNVVPAPEEDRPGHAEIPNLRFDNRREDASEEAQQVLAMKLCRSIKGPLP